MEVLKKIKGNKLEEITIGEFYSLKKTDIIDILDYKEIEYKKSWKKDVLLDLTELPKLIKPLIEKRKFEIKEGERLYQEKQRKEKIELLKTGIQIIKFEKENEIKGTITLKNGDIRAATRVTDYYCNGLLDAWVISYGGNKWIYIEDHQNIIQVTK